MNENSADTKSSVTWLLQDKTNFQEWKNLLALSMAAIFSITIGELLRADGNFSPLAIFFDWVESICAMILPGLSGAFVLVLSGVYEYNLTSLVEFNFLRILVFMSGCVLGSMAFSRVLAWLLKKYHELGYGFITGTLLGSLSISWIWQHAQDFYTDRDGAPHVVSSIKVWPTQYAELTNLDPKMLLTWFCLLTGGLLVLGLEWIFAKTKANAGAGNNSRLPSDGGL